MTNLTFLMKPILTMQLSKNITLLNHKLDYKSCKIFGPLIPMQLFMKMDSLLIQQAVMMQMVLEVLRPIRSCILESSLRKMQLFCTARFKKMANSFMAIFLLMIVIYGTTILYVIAHHFMHYQKLSNYKINLSTGLKLLQQFNTLLLLSIKKKTLQLLL